MQQPALPAPPVQRLASDEITLHLDHVSLTGSALTSTGVTLYAEQGAQKGAVIFNLVDLEQGRVWYTENGNTVQRISSSEVMLGDSLTIPIVAARTIDDDLLKMPLLSPRAGTAEDVIEDFAKGKLADGIPFHKQDKATDRWQENGRVFFDLDEFPLLEEYYFLSSVRGGDTKPLFKICRLDQNTFLINHREYQAKSTNASPTTHAQSAPRTIPTSPRATPTDSPTTTMSSSSPLSSALAIAANNDAEDAIQLQKFRERTGKVGEKKQKERQERLARMMQQISVSYDSPSPAGTPPASVVAQHAPATPAPASAPSPAARSTDTTTSPTTSPSSQFIETLATSISDRKAALRAQRKREMEAELERKYASSPSKPVATSRSAETDSASDAATTADTATTVSAPTSSSDTTSS